jgi:cyclophilin family peptidyl-prolyl cis-trans isomerase
MSRRAAGDSLRVSALAALDTLVHDPAPHVRIEAVRALASYGGTARAQVLAAIHDPDANVRVTAAQSLGAVLDDTRGTWMDAWRADTGFMYRESLLASALSQDVVLPAADWDNPDGWTHMGDWRYRAAVASAGSQATSVDRIREVSLPLARDPDPRVRAAAYAAFAPHVDSAAAEHHPWRRGLMLWALEDYDCFVRAIAIGSLRGHAAASEAPAVLRSYQLAVRRDSLSDAKIAAIRYLAAAWRRDSAAFSDSLRSAIAALPAPTDPRVQAAARGASLFAAWPRPVPSERPLAWYAQRVRDLVVPALAGQLPHADIVTDRGRIRIELFALDAPLTVDNFLSLARAGYYDEVRFHRIVPNFVVQDGDRRGDGNGGPAYSIRDELNRRRYDRGAVGMALSGPDTGGSQYFIALSPQPHLDGGYTVFGHVVSGYDALDALVQGDRIVTIRPR